MTRSKPHNHQILKKGENLPESTCHYKIKCNQDLTRPAITSGLAFATIQSKHLLQFVVSCKITQETCVHIMDPLG